MGNILLSHLQKSANVCLHTSQVIAKAIGSFNSLMGGVGGPSVYVLLSLVNKVLL